MRKTQAWELPQVVNENFRLYLRNEAEYLCVSRPADEDPLYLHTIEDSEDEMTLKTFCFLDSSERPVPERAWYVGTGLLRHRGFDQPVHLFELPDEE